MINLSIGKGHHFRNIFEDKGAAVIDWSSDAAHPSLLSTVNRHRVSITGWALSKLVHICLRNNPKLVLTAGFRYHLGIGIAIGASSRRFRQPGAAIKYDSAVKASDFLL